MEYLTGVYLTDEELQNGKQYHVKELERLIWMSKSGKPSSISHDVHRTVGWSKVNGIYLSHEKAYVFGNTGIAETDEELQRIKFATKMAYYKKTEDALDLYGKELSDLLVKKGLEGKEKRITYNNMLTMGYNGIVAELYPKLVEKKDDDDLVLIDDILQSFKYIGQGVFREKVGNLAIMLHPYLRLSQSIYNDFDYRFVKMLMDVYKTGNRSVKVKIDLDRVGYAPSFLWLNNDDFWLIPDYDDSIDFIGDSKNFQMPASYAVFNQLDRTEYNWANKENGFKQLEVEEVKTDKAPTFVKETYTCRYLHVMIDKKKGVVSHFDGAIRAYDEDRYYDRVGVTMDKAGHSADYTKLFRMDGEIPVSVWKRLITQYLHGNPSVYEFLGIDVQKDSIKKSVNPINPLHKYVPYIISKGDGVRIYVSYHENLECHEERMFGTTEIVDTQEGRVACMEFQAIEVAKAIWKEGGKLELPEGMKYIIVEDYIHNIPIIMHGNENLADNLKVTLNGIKRLMRCHTGKGDEDVYSICLSWNMEGANVRLSILGHVDDMYRWIKKNNVIPTDHKNFTMWIDRQSKLLKKNGRETESPVGYKLVKGDGVLYLQRRPVLKDATSIGEYVKEQDGYHGKLVIDDDKEDLVDLVIKRKISPTPELIATGAKCCETGEDYLKTEKSGIFGEVTYTPECEMLGFMWTTKARPVFMG